MNKMYEVEDIVDCKYFKNKRKWLYEIKWAGYPSDQNTWEPEEHLRNLGNVFTDFKKNFDFKKNTKKAKTHNKKSSKKPPLNLSQQKIPFVVNQTPFDQKINQDDSENSIQVIEQLPQKSLPQDIQRIDDTIKREFYRFFQRYIEIEKREKIQKQMQFETGDGLNHADLKAQIVENVIQQDPYSQPWPQNSPYPPIKKKRKHNHQSSQKLIEPMENLKKQIPLIILSDKESDDENKNNRKTLSLNPLETPNWHLKIQE